MIALAAMGGLSAAALVFWALFTVHSEPSDEVAPDRQAYHDSIITAAARTASSD